MVLFPSAPGPRHPAPVTWPLCLQAPGLLLGGAGACFQPLSLLKGTTTLLLVIKMQISDVAGWFFTGWKQRDASLGAEFEPLLGEWPVST